MTAQDCLEELRRIKDAAFATVDETGAPQVRIIDVMLAEAGALLPARGADTLRIATKPMTEQYVLGEMLDLLVEQDTGLNVELTQGVGGGTSNIQPAMENGEFDLYPEYTGTAWGTAPTAAPPAPGLERRPCTAAAPRGTIAINKGTGAPAPHRREPP